MPKSLNSGNIFPIALFKTSFNYVSKKCIDSLINSSEPNLSKISCNYLYMCASCSLSKKMDGVVEVDTGCLFLLLVFCSTMSVYRTCDYQSSAPKEILTFSLFPHCFFLKSLLSTCFKKTVVIQSQCYYFVYIACFFYILANLWYIVPTTFFL